MINMQNTCQCINNISAYFLSFSGKFSSILMALESELAKQRTWYQNSGEALYFHYYLIHPNEEFPHVVPRSQYTLLCIFLRDWIGHNMLRESLFWFTLRKWGSRSSKCKLACITVSLSNTNTQQILHLTRISTHYSYMHTISQASPNTHCPHLKAALQRYDYEGTGPLFRAWKYIPQVRQVVYQVGCTVLKLRGSDTGRGEGV